MKVTKAPETAAYAVSRRSQMPLQKGEPPAKEKQFDQFTAAPAERVPEQNSTPTVDQVAHALRKQFPWVTFTFQQLGDRPEDLAEFAVSAGKGVHLVMDLDLLDWMAQGEDAWTQGVEMISKTLHDLMLQTGEGTYNRGAVLAEDGETTLWSAQWERPKTELEKDFEFMTDILERQKEAQQRQEEMQKKLKLEEKKKLNYQMGKDLARLAKGTTDRDVRSLISHLYANRQKIAGSSGYNRREVQMALAEMDHVIRRAKAKIRHLKEEGDLHLRMKKAEKQKEEQRRMQLEQELKARRRNRMAKERAAIHEKLPDLPGLRDEEERREAQAQMVLGGMAAGAISTEGTPAVPAVDAASTVTVASPSGGSVEVTITPMV